MLLMVFLSLNGRYVDRHLTLRDVSQPKGRMVVKDGEKASNCSKGNAIFTRVCSVIRRVQSTGEKKGKWMEGEARRGQDGE